MVFSDNHCHLSGLPADPERLKWMLGQAKANEVVLILSMGMNLDSSEDNIHLAKTYPEIKAAVGIHPWNAIPPTDEVRRRMEEFVREEHVVAIGEIGLDYVRHPDTQKVQRDLLKYELSLAKKTGLPVSLHCRGAHQDMMDILHGQIGPELRGVIHGFSGSYQELVDWYALGFYISIGRRGFLIDEAPPLISTIGSIPMDRLLIETDSAGTNGSPSDVIAVAEKLASLRGITTEEVGDIATANLKRLLAIEKKSP